MDRGGVFDASDLWKDCLDLDPDPEAAAARQAERAELRAMRTSTRARASRAAGEAALADALPPRIATGDAWHIATAGDVDGMSYLAHLLKAQPADHVVLSTWCMALDDVEQLAAWIAAGTIKRLDVYVGEIFPSQYAAAHTALCEAVRANPAGGRVAVFRNHAKVTVLAAHRARYYVTVESSANLNTNPRNEQACITRGRKLAEFYRRFFDGVRSITRNFDDWAPDGWQAT